MNLRQVIALGSASACVTRDDPRSSEASPMPGQQPLVEIALHGVILQYGTSVPLGSTAEVVLHAEDLGGRTELARGTSAPDGAYDLPAVEAAADAVLLLSVAPVEEPSSFVTTSLALGGADWYEVNPSTDTVAMSVEQATYYVQQASLAGQVARGGGFLHLWVDDSRGSPLGGATVTCPGPCVPLYSDGVDDDGLFSSDGGTNAETHALSGALVVVLDAPFGSYVVEDPLHAWAPLLSGLHEPDEVRLDRATAEGLSY